MKSNTALTVIFVTVVVAILVGEAYIYTLDTGRYSSDVRVTADGIEYSVTSGGSECYSVLVLDNGTFEMNDKFYIYYDPEYGSSVESVKVPVGAKELTQEYYISQLIKMFEYRGITNVQEYNADDLRTAMSDDIAYGNISKGLIVLSGALPDTVYKGDAGDLIFDWLSEGGSLYWAGNLLGAYVSKSGKTVAPVTGDYETLFFGQSDCLYKGDSNTDLSDITTNDYRHTLSMMNNNIRYGINPSVLNQQCLTVGYTDGTYCSTALIKFGQGMICVLAGDYSSNQRHDLAQLVSSGICYSTATEPAGYASGDVKRNTVTGSINLNFVIGNNYIVYIYYGGYFPVYGKTAGWLA